MTIQAALGSSLTSGSPSGSVYTVVSNQNTFKITITSSLTQFKFDSISTMNKSYFQLGFNSTNSTTQSYSLSQVSSGSYSLDFNDIVLIEVPQLSTANMPTAFTFSAVINGNSRDSVTFTQNSDYSNIWYNWGATSISYLNFKLFDSLHNPLNLIGGSVKIMLEILDKQT